LTVAPVQPELVDGQSSAALTETVPPTTMDAMEPIAGHVRSLDSVQDPVDAPRASTPDALIHESSTIDAAPVSAVTLEPLLPPPAASTDEPLQLIDVQEHADEEKLEREGAVLDTAIEEHQSVMMHPEPHTQPPSGDLIDETPVSSERLTPDGQEALPDAF
jgi:hypothetical protein